MEEKARRWEKSKPAAEEQLRGKGSLHMERGGQDGINMLAFYECQTRLGRNHCWSLDNFWVCFFNPFNNAEMWMSLSREQMLWT